MRLVFCVVIFTGVLLIGMRQGFCQNTFGIEPLHSTRADVERLYGVSADSCHCVFRTPKEIIDVVFATAPCEGPEYGWNVPRDTVLSFTIRPSVPQRLSEVASTLSGFVKRYSPGDLATTYYSNAGKGVVFAVQDDHITYVKYFPPRHESGKRCEGFPSSDGVPPPDTFAKIFIRDKENVESRLDNFAAALSTTTQLRGYIITYAGKKSHRREAREMADEAKKYLVEKRMISPDRFMTIDGGFRETAQYDLFTLNPQMPPPTPTPTVPANEVQIIGPPSRPNPRRQ
jgi:hypothetical protein